MSNTALKVAPVMLSLALAVSACGHGSHETEMADTINHLPDTLRVATLYSPTSYFIYREEQMGYDYTLVRDFCDDKGMVLDLNVAPSLEYALQWLDSGMVDLVAYEIPVTDIYNKLVRHCGPVTTTTQVLVQPRSDNPVRDVTDLVGRDVYVEKNSKYWQRLENLNSEVGGGINIHTVARDTIITEDLLEMVAKGTIPLTVVDSDVARLNRTYYPQLDIEMAVSFGQKAEWGVATEKAWLADSINAWMGDDRQRKRTDAIYKRYFEMSKNIPSIMTYDLSHGHISPYDHFFKKYAKDLGWDWRLLAAQGFIESRFDSNVVSWAGARGIMQIMPGTARANGFNPASLTDPETSIRAAVKVLSALDRTMARYITDPKERQRFVLAAYNAGGAHILDAITLARKTGRDSMKWNGQVEQALLLKADPKYYNDAEVKFGYFRGRQTVEYVRQVMDFYNKCVKKIKA